MHEIRMRRKRRQRTGASSSANSFRNLGGMPSGPEALSVFKELEAATWKSNPVFASFYLRDVSLAFDGFRALGPVVAAGSVVN